MKSILALTFVTAIGFAQGPPPQQGVNPLLTPNPYNSPPEVKGGPVPRTPDGKPDLQGVWLVRAPGNSMSMISVETTTGRGGRKGVVIDPPDGRIPSPP